MYYIEFSLIRRDLIEMGKGRSVEETTKLRTEFMNKELEKAQEEYRKGYEYKPPECVFPPWLVEIFKSLSVRYRYEPMNQIARVFFITTDEREKAADKFEASYKALYNSRDSLPKEMKDAKDFMEKFQVLTGLYDNTMEAIAVDEDLQEEFQAEAIERAKEVGLSALPTWDQAMKEQNISEAKQIETKKDGAIKRAWRWLVGSK